jgi:hypothetical protein
MNLYFNESDMETLETIGANQPYAQLLWNITIPTKERNKYFVGRQDALEWKDVVDAGRTGFLPGVKGDLRRKITEFYRALQG